MKRTGSQRDNLIWLLFFFVFSACLLAVLLCGATVYQGVSRQLEEGYELHTGLDYLEARIRSYDRQGGLSVGEFDGHSALLCSDGDDGYVTAIYCADGALRELYSQVGTALDAQAGEALLDMDAVAFSQRGRLLTVTCTRAGEQASATLFLRSGGTWS